MLKRYKTLNPVFPGKNAVKAVKSSKLIMNCKFEQTKNKKLYIIKYKEKQADKQTDI